MNEKIAIFKGKEIRRTIYNDEWWFSVSDIVEIISESADVKQYIKKQGSNCIKKWENANYGIDSDTHWKRCSDSI